MSTYDFSTLYTTLPHNLIKEKLLDLIEQTFYKKEGELYLACNDKKAFFTSKDHYVSPEGLGDILFFPGRPSVCLSVCLSVCPSVCLSRIVSAL